KLAAQGGVRPMDAVLWALLGVVAGACIAVQAPLNTQLGKDLAMPVAAAAMSFLAGAVVLVVVMLVVSRVQGSGPHWAAPAPWLYFAGGTSGTGLVHAGILLTPRVGAAEVQGVAVPGTLVAGIVLDRIGFMGL